MEPCRGYRRIRLTNVGLLATDDVETGSKLANLRSVGVADNLHALRIALGIAHEAKQAHYHKRNGCKEFFHNGVNLKKCDKHLQIYEY